MGVRPSGNLSTDNSVVVYAVKKIKKGLNSTRPRLQTLMLAIQKYDINFYHVSRKLPLNLMNVMYFASRNPMECKEKTCRVCGLLPHSDLSFSTINFSEI